MLHDILLVLIGLIIGAVIGFFIARTVTKKYLKKNKGVYLYYFNIKEYRDQANSQEATKKEKSRYNQMRKKLDFSWTPTLKLVINGKFVDQYTFLDEDYYSLPSKKQKEKKQDYIDKLSSWLDQIYQD